MRRYLALTALLLTACGDDGGPTVYYDLDATGSAAGFWDYPLPSDQRLDGNGAPDFSTFPNPRNVPILTSLLSIVPDRRGWSTMPTAYFRFTAAPPARTTDVVYVQGPAYLVDIDPDSPELGSTFPIVIKSLAKDPYTPDHVVAVAPRPGIVLRATTRYAFVLMRDFAPDFARPSSFAIDATLGAGLTAAGIDDADVLVATTFTTGDEILRIRNRSEAIRAAHDVTLTGFALVGGDTYSGFCHISAQVSMPQFQTGTQPFDSGGLFELDGSDIPAKQGDLTIPVVITLPKQAMPATGWPLYQFFHGSGGVSTGLVDLGYSPVASDMPEPGKGPGYVVARHGIASVSAALPVNPERLATATDYAYLNINNLAAFPQTFQQGIFEQRLLLDALLALRIPDSVLTGCTGITSPGGEHFFNAQKLVAGGQSMGGMYTNLIGAVEERYGAFVPTGAGGFWNLMILDATVVPGARALLGTALGIDDAELSFVHPALHVMANAWEIAEPFTAMARLARRPLPGLPARHIYQPVGKDDENFSTLIFDAAALAYGNEQAGTPIWSSMQDALALDGLDGLEQYPVSGNIDGKTRVVVQFEGDGLIDPHYIYRQLETVKHQYGCFFATYMRDGVPTLPPPNVLVHPCL